eukprot:m51a1_g10720 hypothetical protein (431) ;mRNA; r:225985-228257
MADKSAPSQPQQAQQARPKAAAPKKWSALFQPSPQQAAAAAAQRQQQQHEAAAAVEAECRPGSGKGRKGQQRRLAEVAAQHRASVAPPCAVSIHGLVNTGNKCFLNSVVQSFAACPPVCRLFADLQKTAFFQNFPIIADAKALTDPPISNDVVPSELYDLLPGFVVRTGASRAEASSRATRQQDAQEFYSFLAAAGAARAAEKPEAQAQAQQQEGEDEWLEVGKKNRGVVQVITNTEGYRRSAVSDIFVGRLRSTVRANSGSPPTVSIEPFSCLHLDITGQQVRRVEDALACYFAAESIQGYNGRQLATATKSAVLEQLPLVLVLHLKRFAFESGQGTKVAKHVALPQTLRIPPQFQNGAKTTADYSLFSIISHHGEDIERGHYTCTARHAERWWLLFNDDSVAELSPRQALDQPDAYILFYARHSRAGQ